MREAARYLEASVRVDGLPNSRKGAELDALISDLGVDLVNITPDQAIRARRAYRVFGKGNHPIKLDLGDCFAYAPSRARNELLLFTGDHFRLTDVEAAT